ncbi:hypothetical protein [Thermosulfurimonas sp. F29]|uniref:hypothetical protein n=1 Tax=Thermosulfurimonas sp. F29 TaxID=2867247 RepID=UPI001C8304A5|nr:hypothetical protein [Thermosulfurimonas sp. F29]MBX6422204.1 hypothetical protein [Thermosulfurimonas sp. F29]
MRRWILGFVLLFFSACATKPGVNLASKACMVHKGLSTRAEVRYYLGPPRRVERLPDGREVWIYYEVKKDTLARIPGLGEKLGREKVEVLRITFSGDRVVDCIYYVSKPGT